MADSKCEMAGCEQTAEYVNRLARRCGHTDGLLPSVQVCELHARPAGALADRESKCRNESCDDVSRVMVV